MVADTEVKVVDVETGTRTSPSGECEELIGGSPQIMKGYWNKPKVTKGAEKECL